MSHQKLFLCNAGISDPNLEHCLQCFEREWIEQQRSQCHLKGQVPRNFAEFSRELNAVLHVDENVVFPDVKFVEEDCGRSQMRMILAEYAPDGLTEAKAVCYVISRLDCKAQAAIVRIFLDEFGCGNLKRVHTTLYRNLLQEVDLPLAPEFYVNTVREESLEVVNLWHWMACRASKVDFYLGALAYAEATI